MKRAKLTTDVWEIDTSKEEEEDRIAYGDSVYSMGKTGDTCWVSSEDEDSLCVVQETRPTRDEMDRNGFCIREQGYTLDPEPTSEVQPIDGCLVTVKSDGVSFEEEVDEELLSDFREVLELVCVDHEAGILNAVRLALAGQTNEALRLLAIIRKEALNGE